MGEPCAWPPCSRGSRRVFMLAFASRWRTWTLAGGAAVLLAFLGWMYLAASPAVGTWKVTVLSEAQESTLWLLKIESKGRQARAMVLSALPNLKGSKVTSAQVDDHAVRFTIHWDDLEFTGVAYLPPG